MDLDVTTSSGAVRGAARERHLAFLGIPYASPPVGARRFLAPLPVQPWTGVRDALEPGPRRPAGPARALPVPGRRRPRARTACS